MEKEILGWFGNFNKINLNVNDIDQFLKTIDIVIFRTKLIVDKDLIDLFPDVKMFIRSGSGFENIDFLYCFKKNILTCEGKSVFSI